jgi:N-acetyltransferase 10
LNVPSSQLLAMLIKIMRKISTAFRAIVEGAVSEDMPEQNGHAADTMDGIETANDRKFAPLTQTLDDELREGGEQVASEMKEKQRQLVDALPLER